MRTELERRPLLFFLACLILGLTAVSHSWNLLLLPLILWIGRPLNIRMWAAAGFAFGLLLMPEPIVVSSEGYIRTEAKVTSRPNMTDYGWTVRATVGGAPMLLVGTETPPSEGELIQVTGVSKPMPWNGAWAGMFRADTVTTVREAPAILQAADSWRQALTGLLRQSTMNEQDQRFLAAICFGSDMLSREELQEARNLGWLRIMSASGIQVLALAAVLESLFRLLPVPRLAVVVLLTLVLVTYALAAGHHASTERAVLAVILARWAYLFRRQPDLLSALAASGAVILLLDPLQVYALGFHLTMITVGAFALFGSRLSFTRKGLRDRIAMGGSVLAKGLLIASLAAIPLVAQAFHVASFSGVLAMVLVATLVPLLISAAFVAQLLALFAPTAGLGLVEIFCAPLTEGIRRFLEVTSMPGLTLEIPYFSGYVLLPYYALWLLLWRKRERPA